MDIGDESIHLFIISISILAIHLYLSAFSQLLLYSFHLSFSNAWINVSRFQITQNKTEFKYIFAGRASPSTSRAKQQSAQSKYFAFTALCIVLRAKQRSFASVAQRVRACISFARVRCIRTVLKPLSVSIMKYLMFINLMLIWSSRAVVVVLNHQPSYHRSICARMTYLCGSISWVCIIIRNRKNSDSWSLIESRIVCNRT